MFVLLTYDSANLGKVSGRQLASDPCETRSRQRFGGSSVLNILHHANYCRLLAGCLTGGAVLCTPLPATAPRG